MSVRPVELNTLASVVGGGLCGLWIHGVDLRPTTPSKSPSRFVRCYARLHQGKLGIITAAATGSFCLLAVDKITQHYFSEGLHSRWLTWPAFLAFTISSEKNESLSCSKILRQSIITLIVTYCFKHIFPWILPLQLIPPTSIQKSPPAIFWIGMFWGFILITMKDERQQPSPAPNSNLEKVQHWLKTFHRNSIVGHLFDLYLTTILFDLLYSVCVKAFEECPNKKIVQYAFLSSYLVSSSPFGVKNFNTLEAVISAWFYTSILMGQAYLINNCERFARKFNSQIIYKESLMLISRVIFLSGWLIRGSKYLENQKNVNFSSSRKFIYTLQFIINFSASLLARNTSGNST